MTTPTTPKPNSNRPIIVRPRRPKLKWRFRWAWVWVPAAALLTLWVIHGIEPAGSWDDLMDFMNVHQRNRYTQLAVLGLVTVAIVAIARVLKPPSDEED